ncbi:MAG TPA: kelch repeat-containing protein [Candidatus Binataceae bacterium]|nr:kelch repeat-containing protein [Candidatus Binataceae bacterium]
MLLLLLLAGCLDPCSNCVSTTATGPGTFSKTGPLKEERAFASAAGLPGGNTVLIAGGGRVPGYLTRAQILNPAASPMQFAADAELHQARANHGATLLQNGHVLVTGGDNGVEALNSSEIYVANGGSTGSFIEAASMVAPRTHHTATLLKDGRVLITGGSPAVGQEAVIDPMTHQTVRTDAVPVGALNTAELFGKNTGNFVGVFDAMTSARTEHTATLLKDGTVLIVGGADQNGVALASAEIFDPGSLTFTPTASPLSVARFDHTATLIRCGKGCDFDGDVLIAGGFTNSIETIAVAELYDPAFKSFHPVATMTAGRALHTAIELDDGSVLVAGGIENDASQSFVNLDSAEVFEVSPTSMNEGNFVPAANTMSAVRAGAAAIEVKLGGASKILETFGGEADFNAAFFSSLPSADFYDPASMSFSQGPASPPTCTVSSLNPFGCAITRAAHTATVLNDGRVLIVGGLEATRVVLNSTEIYDLSAGSGSFSAGPDLNEARVFQTSSVIEGSTFAGDILVAGGNPPCDGSAELYDLTTKQFMLTGLMTSTNRCTFFSATALADGRVLLAGGLDGNMNVLDTAEVYDPATNSFTAVGNLSHQRWGHLAIQLTDGSNDVLIAGGQDCTGDACGMEANSGFLQSAELFDPTTNTFTPLADSLKEARFFASANNLPNPGKVASANNVLIAGGSGDNSSELYDPAAGSFGVGPGMNFIRFFQPGTNLPGDAGLVLLTGGSGKSAFAGLLPLSSAEVFDPVHAEFCRTGDMSIGRAFHAAIAVGSGKELRVLVAGGVGDNSSLGTAELYTPIETCPVTGSTVKFKSTARARESLSAAMSGYLQAMSLH